MLNFKQNVADLTQFLGYADDFRLLTYKVLLQIQELKHASVSIEQVFFS
jgi:hypothetical protein